MTKDEFEAAYARASGITVERLHELGRHAEPCDCGDPICQRWAMVRRRETTTPDIDDEYTDEDPRCTMCGGEVWVECDDPIQCTYPRCDGELHPDPACGGTGLAEHQVIW